MIPITLDDATRGSRTTWLCPYSLDPKTSRPILSAHIVNNLIHPQAAPLLPALQITRRFSRPVDGASTVFVRTTSPATASLGFDVKGASRNTTLLSVMLVQVNLKGYLVPEKLELTLK